MTQDNNNQQPLHHNTPQYPDYETQQLQAENTADPEAAKEVPKKKSNFWKANIQLLIVLAFIIGGFILSQNLKVDEEKQAQETSVRELLVQTKTITPTTKQIKFTRTGNISVNGQINIVPQVSGRVVSVHKDFNDGGVFEKNQTLFQIEQADFINRVNIAKAQVEQARTALTLQKAESNAAIAEWNNINPNRSAPSLVAKKPQLQQANANLKAAQAQLSEAQLALNRTKFSYNFAGRIVDTTIEQGQFIQAGQSYGQAYPRDALEVVVPVEDKILQYMNIEESDVTIRTNYRGQNVTLQGTIDRVGSVVNQTTRFVDVVIKPKSSDWDILMPGVFVEVDLIGKNTENVWTLPNEAMQGTNDIWIVRNDNTLSRYFPEIITTKENQTEAIGNGETINVVLGLLKGANEGMTVRVSNGSNSNAQDKEEIMGGAPPQMDKTAPQNSGPITSPVNDQAQ